MSVSYWLNQTVEKRKYDAVIIGAGIAGLSTAYWLQQKHPTIKIAVIEKNSIGSGASGRNAGFVTCGSIEHFLKLEKQFGLEKALEIWRFSEVNHQLLKQHVIEDDQEKLEYKKTGACTVAPDQIQWEKYQEVAKTLSSANISVELIPTDRLEKEYGINGFSGGLEYQNDGVIHPIKLLQKLAQKISIDLIENTEVYQLDQQQNIQTIKTDRGIFEADQVYLTLNAYLPLLLPSFSPRLTPGRGQILLTEPLPLFIKGPCYLAKHLCYFRQLPSGHLLVGGFRNLDLHSENTYIDQTTELIQNALLQFAKSHFIYRDQIKVGQSWAGIMGFSKDGQMLIGPSPENPGLHIMAGCSGHGMGLSFHAARCMVEKNIPDQLKISRAI